MRWGQPDLIWLVAIPVIVLAAFVYGHLVRRSLLSRLGELKLVRELVKTVSMERRLFKQLIVFLAIVLLTLAALRLQYRRPGTLRQSESMSQLLSTSVNPCWLKTFNPLGCKVLEHSSLT